MTNPPEENKPNIEDNPYITAEQKQAFYADYRASEATFYYSDPIVVTPPRREEVFTLPEGDVIVQWPAEMSIESIRAFEAWFQVLRRKIEWSARKPKPLPEEGEKPCL